MGTNNDNTPIRVQVEAHKHPNLAKLARALIALAKAELEREQAALNGEADDSSGEVAA